MSTAEKISSTTESAATNTSPSKVSKPTTPGTSAKYKQLVKQLKINIAKQDKLEDELDAIENTIYKRESVYLGSTANIIKGFDSYTGSSGSHPHGHYSNINNGIVPSNRNNLAGIENISTQASAAAALAAGANVSVLDNNRIFSLSSATFVKQINNMNKEVMKSRE
jgi:hypothetical protein